MSEARPKQLSPEMRLSAARLVVADLIKEGRIEDASAEQYAKDIAEYGRRHIDGYQLAKELDEHCYWECDLAMAETLDGFSSYARSEIEAAEKAWAERVNPSPPLAIGARVRLPRGETGTIDEIYKYGTAKFCIAVDGDPKAGPPSHARRIVDFEDVTQVIAEQQGYVG